MGCFRYQHAPSSIGGYAPDGRTGSVVAGLAPTLDDENVSNRFARSNCSSSSAIEISCVETSPEYETVATTQGVVGAQRPCSSCGARASFHSGRSFDVACLDGGVCSGQLDTSDVHGRC